LTAAMMKKGNTGITLETKSVIKGSSYLQAFWEGKRNKRNKALKEINSKEYDYVVLQGSSSVTSGASRKIKRESFFQHAEKFIKLIRENGAKPVLYCTWAQSAKKEDTDKTIEANKIVSEQFNVPVIPVGQAWNLAETRRIKLYVDDNWHHQNELGIYLNACVFYGFFTGKSPEGRKMRKVARNKKFESPPGTKVIDNKTAELDDKTALALQKLAWETIQKCKKNNEKVSVASHSDNEKVSVASHSDEGKHLILLSGQSNMHFLNLNLSFIPAVNKALGKENVILVKSSKSGKPIINWCKEWKSPDGRIKKGEGKLYDGLMKSSKKATKGTKIQTVTFIWMQGESDARKDRCEDYKASLEAVLNQLRTDLGRKDLNFVIGRISDHALKRPAWMTVRKAQEEIADSDKRGVWVNTDDLNEGIGIGQRKGETVKNDLHYSVSGFKILGKRFAEKAIALIKNEIQ